MAEKKNKRTETPVSKGFDAEMDKDAEQAISESKEVTNTTKDKKITNARPKSVKKPDQPESKENKEGATDPKSI